MLKKKLIMAILTRVDLEKAKIATKAKRARLLSLFQKEETKIANIIEGMNVVDSSILEISQQDKLKAQLMASTKIEVGKWSNNLAKAHREKAANKKKWEEFQDKLGFLEP